MSVKLAAVKAATNSCAYVSNLELFNYRPLPVKMGRREKCWQCDRRRTDVSLRICDDRLCQDCDDLNRAACEGRACADQCSDAETESATTTTGTMSKPTTSTESKSIRNELLCYVANKMDLVVHDSLIKLCTDFYDTKLIESAKQILFDCSAVADCGVRHQRRQGPSRDKNNMEDILLAFHRCTNLPEFVAGDLSRLPPLDMNNIDFAHLLHEFQGMRSEMAKMRDEFKRCKPISQSGQRDEPWSKPNSGATVVNLPAMREDKCLKAVRTTVPTPMAARTTVSTPKAALTTVTSSTVTTPKTALVRVTTPNDARKVCAAVSIDSIENETVGNEEINNCGDNDVDHGYTRVTRKRSGRTKAVIGTNIGTSSLKVKTGRYVSLFVSRLDPGTSHEDLETYFRDTHKLAAACTQLTTKHDSYASFKVDVMCDSAADLYNSDKWPAGVYLRKFFRQNV